MFRIIFFASLGLILGGTIVVITTGPFTSIWPIEVGAIVAAFSGVFWFAGRIITSGSTPPVHATTHAARVAGRLGVARIDASNHKGTMINYQPQMEFEVTVQPRHGNAYRTSVLKVVPVGEVHKFEPGSLHNVVILAEGQPDIALVDATPKEDLIGVVHVPEKELAGKLLRRSPYSLRPDGTRRRPIIGTDRKSRPARIAVYVIAFLVATGAVIYPYQAAIAQTFTSIQSGKLRADLREPEPLNQAIDALTERIGHGYSYRVQVTALEVLIDAPLAPEKKESDQWSYHAAMIQREGPSSSQAASAQDQFPLSEVNWGALWPAAKKASAMSGIKSIDDVEFVVERSSTASGQSRPVRVTFSLRDDYHSAQFEMNADGSELTMMS